VANSILVINPNSTEAVTRGIDEACEPLRIPGGPAVDCMTLEEGPPGIETQRHMDSVVGPLLRLVSEREREHAAFVIACYSDPGVHSLRELTKKPVLGISECGILTALTLGQRFGVIAILQTSIARHLRYVGALGVADRLAGELAVGLRVPELADRKKTFARMVEIGRRLRDDHGADVVVMGCAGMARYRDPLQDAIGVPVVEPTQAAVAMAIGRVRLGWHVRSRLSKRDTRARSPRPSRTIRRRDP
jgi:Asp/Glu/hydantoin racemase